MPIDEANRFRAVFDESPSGMALVEVLGPRVGRIIEANGSLAELTGYPVGALQGMPYENLLAPEEIEDDRALIRELVLGRRRRYRVEQRVRYADGGIRWALASGALAGRSRRGRLEAIRELQDIERQKAIENQLKYLADHDSLTGLFNRRRFSQELSAAVAKAGRESEPGAIFVVDVDHLKRVNDTFGHSAGDEVLRNIARLLRERLRDTDVLGRIGGDEFAVLVPRMAAEEVAPLAMSLLRIVRKVGASIPSPEYPVSASVGITRFGTGGADSGADLLIDADRAMYDAKGAGRDRFSLYREAGRPSGVWRSRQSWSGQIRKAIESDEFAIVVQPIVRLRDREVTGYELLLRMTGDNGELLLPESFMYSAERSGLAQEIDRWVLVRALELLADRPALRLAVNLSADSLVDSTVIEFLAQQVERLGIDASALTLEVTETAAIADMEKARSFTTALHRLGCRLALDDFGAGFGSFFYLKYLTPDYLKIDGEFIRSLSTSPIDCALVAGMVETANRLGIETVAEFVGDEETVAILAECGVEYGQGNHLGRPAALGEAIPGRS